MIELHTATRRMGTAKFVRKLHEEVEEIEDELDSFFNELRYPSFDSDSILSDLSDNLLSECFDVMQVVYTFMLNHYSEEEIEIANKKHIEKLTARYGPTGEIES